MRALWTRKKLPLIYQAETSECGLACLAMVAAYHGRELGLNGIRRSFPVSLRGVSLRKLVEISQQLGLHTTIRRVEIDEISRVRIPVLLHWDLEHMVVLKRASRGRFVIHDPSRGVLKLGRAELSNHFSGVMVEMEPTTGFDSAPPERKLTAGDLLGSGGRWKASLAQILALSAILELFVLAQPIFLRSIVDTAIANQDLRLIRQLVVVLAIAAAALGGTSFLRDCATLRAGTVLNLEMMQRVFRHVLALPLSFFEKRSIGHLIERYRATDDVERFVLSIMPLALIDGLMALLSLGLLFRFAAPLAALSLLTVVAYFAIRHLGYGAAKAREQAMVWAKGEENGHLLETLRSIFTTKAAGIESTRYQGWLQKYSELVDCQLRSYGFEAAYRALKLGLMGLNVACLLSVAGHQAVSGTITTGILLSALFYNSHFNARANALVERFFELKLLAVRLERLEDLLFAQPESLPAGAPPIALEPARQAVRSSRALQGEIVLEHVSFRYSPADPLILHEASCRIAPGEFVALAGDNGAGKTTLLKLLLGLYRPTSGRIFYDGVSLDSMPLDFFRRQIGVVAQDDSLFNGSVAQNIALFDPEMNVHRVAEVAEMASVRDDIESAPMGYSTRVGQLSSPFSEGQKQKILLARALYREPRILILDEGTANLDDASERRILTNLEQLSATKVMVAHRPATLRRAGRTLLVANGTLAEVRGEVGTSAGHLERRVP